LKLLIFFLILSIYFNSLLCEAQSYEGFFPVVGIDKLLSEQFQVKLKIKVQHSLWAVRQTEPYKIEYSHEWTDLQVFVGLKLKKTSIIDIGYLRFN